MNRRRWQLAWTLLFVLWTVGWAAPMALLLLRGDREQLGVYFGMWIAVVLVPGVVVYLVALLVGRFMTSVDMAGPRSQPARRRTVRVAGLLGWTLLVGILCAALPGPLNPFERFATPLAVAVALLAVMVPPLLLYAAGSALHRMRTRARSG